VRLKAGGTTPPRPKNFSRNSGAPSRSCRTTSSFSRPSTTPDDRRACHGLVAPR
jgi:hypothetical protein